MALVSTLLQCPKDAGTAEGMLLASTKLTPGGSPSATTGHGFSATVTQEATGDYTLNFASTFATAPRVWASPLDTSDKLYFCIYSVSTTQVRVRFYNEGGTLTDPVTADVFALGA